MKTALVTGGSGDIGRAIGQALIADGYRVGLLDLDESKVMAAANELAAQWSAAMSDIATNGELAKIIETGLDRVEDLAPHEYVQFSAHLNRVFRDVENMFTQYNAGRLDQDLWNGISTSTIQFTNSAGVKHWWGTRDGWYGKPFSEFIQSYIDQTAGPTLSYREAGGKPRPVESLGGQN